MQTLAKLATAFSLFMVAACSNGNDRNSANGASDEDAGANSGNSNGGGNANSNSGGNGNSNTGANSTGNSNGGSGNSGSGDNGGSGSGGDTSSTAVDSGLPDVICAFKTDGSNEMACSPNMPNVFAVSQFTKLISLCAGDNAKLCASTPSSVTLKITTKKAVPLTVDLLNCKTTIHNGADCSPALREMSGVPLAIQTTWGQPNGNAGPMTTIKIEQIGSSVGACSLDTEAIGSHIRIKDPAGYQLVLEYNQSACCDTACP